MWGILVSGGMFVLAIVFSLAKVSSRAEKITEIHRKELLARNKGTDIKHNTYNKKQMKS